MLYKIHLIICLTSRWGWDYIIGLVRNWQGSSCKYNQTQCLYAMKRSILNLSCTSISSTQIIWMDTGWAVDLKSGVFFNIKLNCHPFSCKNNKLQLNLNVLSHVCMLFHGATVYRGIGYVLHFFTTLVWWHISVVSLPLGDIIFPH